MDIEARVISGGEATEGALRAEKWHYKEEAKEYYLNIDAMGAESAKDIDLAVDKETNVVAVKVDRVHRTAIHLPKDANHDDVRAHLEAGLIHIHIGRAAQ